MGNTRASGFMGTFTSVGTLADKASANIVAGSSAVDKSYALMPKPRAMAGKSGKL